MPIIQSARKKMRQDKKRRTINLLVLRKLKKILSLARKNPIPKNLKQVYSLIDQAAKKGIIHKNKAARLKARLAKKAIIEKPTSPKKPVKKGKREKET